MGSSGPLAVASMNLHCGVGSRGQPFDVEAAILKLDAPVIALQETWSLDSGPDPLAAAAKALDAQLFRVPLLSAADWSTLGIPGESGPGSLAMAVLCRLPVAGYEVADLGQMRGDAVRRCAQIVSIELPDRGVLRLAATHLTHRLASPLQLLRLIRRLNAESLPAESLPAESLPTVIAGDLNMPRLLAGTVRGYSPAVYGRTWPADLPVLQLDHILTSSGLDQISGSVLAPAGSDHLPVRAEIRLPAR